MTLKHGTRAVDELFYDIQCLITRYFQQSRHEPAPRVLALQATVDVDLAVVVTAAVVVVVVVVIVAVEFACCLLLTDNNPRHVSKACSSTWV